MLSPDRCRVVAGKNSAALYVHGSRVNESILHQELTAKLSQYKQEARVTISTSPVHQTHQITPIRTFLSTPNKPSHSGGSSHPGSQSSNESSKIQLPLDRKTPVSSFLLPTAPPPSPGEYLEASELPLEPNKQSLPPPPSSPHPLSWPNLNAAGGPPPIIITPADDQASNRIVVLPDAVEPKRSKPTYLRISVAVLLICSFFNPFGFICGITALSLSCIAHHYNSQQHYLLAKRYGRLALLINIMSIIFGTGVVTLFIPIMLVATTRY